MLPLPQQQHQGKPLLLRRSQEPEQDQQIIGDTPSSSSPSHVASYNYRLRSSGHLLNTMPTNINNNNTTTEARIITNNKTSITYPVDEKNNQKSICTQNKNSSRLSSTPFTFSMTTLPNAERPTLSISTENHNEAEIHFLTAEHQQFEKMKHRNSIKKPFFEKALGETENIVWSSTGVPHTNVKPLSPNCQLQWSLSQGRELTQLPATTQARNDIEKLVATGTIWTPSISNKNLRSIQSSLSTVPPATSSAPLLSLKKFPSLNSKQVVSINHPVIRNPQKEADLIYQDPLQDPLVGAPNTFALRVNEISSLEAETVRQERCRKLKKRNKLDRDSSGY